MESPSELLQTSAQLIVADDFECTLVQREEQVVEIEKDCPVRLDERSLGWVKLSMLYQGKLGQSVATYHPGFDWQSFIDHTTQLAKCSDKTPWYRLALWKNQAPHKPSRGEICSQPVADTLPVLAYEKVTTYEESFRILRKHEPLVREEKRSGGHYHFRTQPIERKEIQVAKRWWSPPPSPPSASLETDWREKKAQLFGQDPYLASLAQWPERHRRALDFGGDLGKAILMRPFATSSLLRWVGDWFHGEKLELGLSPLSGQEGEQIFSPTLSFENGTEPESQWDDEGNPATPTVLVEGGKFLGGYYDFLSGLKANRASTGNFRHSLQNPMGSCGLSSLSISPSTHSPLELEQTLYRGVVIEGLTHLEGLRAEDPGATTVKINAFGSMLQSGGEKIPLRNIFLEVDLRGLLKHALMVGNDLVFYGRWGAPSILFGIQPLRVMR